MRTKTMMIISDELMEMQNPKMYHFKISENLLKNPKKYKTKLICSFTSKYIEVFRTNID